MVLFKHAVFFLLMIFSVSSFAAFPLVRTSDRTVSKTAIIVQNNNDHFGAINQIRSNQYLKFKEKLLRYADRHIKASGKGEQKKHGLATFLMVLPLLFAFGAFVAIMLSSVPLAIAAGICTVISWGIGRLYLGYTGIAIAQWALLLVLALAFLSVPTVGLGAVLGGFSGICIEVDFIWKYIDAFRVGWWRLKPKNGAYRGQRKRGFRFY